MDADSGAQHQDPAYSNDAPSFSNIDASSSLRHSRHSRSSRASERESLEEEIRRTVKALRSQVDDERRRADKAERKVAEITEHLKAVNDARLEALRDASRAMEELRLYKIQLNVAQEEIYRAQETINHVDRQRLDAEKEAAKNRNKARQLNETILIQSARDEAYRQGVKEGMDRGRAIAYTDEPYTPYDDDDDEDNYTPDGSQTSYSQSEHPSYYEPPRPRSMTAPSQHSRHSRSNSRAHQQPAQGSHSPHPAPMPLQPDALPVNPPSAPLSVRAPSTRAPSVRAPSARPADSGRAPSPNPSMRPPSTYAPSMRAPSVRPESTRVPSPNPSARPPSTYAPSMRAASPNPSMRPPSMRAPSPNPSMRPSIRAPSPGPPPVPVPAPGSRPPSMRAPSPNPGIQPTSDALPVRAPSRAGSTYAPSIRPGSINLSERMGRPVSVRSVTPTPRHPPIIAPPDNLIPTLDADMRIRLPPPHEFGRTPERGPSPALPAVSSGASTAGAGHGAMSDSSHTSQDPLPIPMRQSASAPGQGQGGGGGGRHRRNSSSGSSALSHLDLFSNPYGGAGLRTPMSIIEEVNSQTASPHDQSMRHQRSFSENSQQPNQGLPRRPPSRSSYAGSQWAADPRAPSPAPSFVPPPSLNGDRRSPSGSYNSDAPNISVQPPSLSNKTDSLRTASRNNGSGSVSGAGGNNASGSASQSQRAPSPAPSQRSAYTNTNTYNAAPAMPGGHHDYYDYANSQAAGVGGPLPVMPLRYEPRSASRQSQTHSQSGSQVPGQGQNQYQPQSQSQSQYRTRYKDDDAVSSAMTGDDSLTTPLAMRPREPFDYSGMEPVWPDPPPIGMMTGIGSGHRAAGR